MISIEDSYNRYVQSRCLEGPIWDDRYATDRPCIRQLVQLTKTPLLKSFLKPTFNQVMQYVFARRDDDKIMQLDHLRLFAAELLEAFDTMFEEDSRAVKRVLLMGDQSSELPSDASFLLYWASVETAKYCINQKFSPSLSTNQFLALLRRELTRPLGFQDKINRRFLLNLWHHVETYLQDKVSKSGLCLSIPNLPKEIEDFLQANCDKFENWLSSNELPVARLSLIVDRPSQCWQNIDARLSQDLVLKFSEPEICSTNDETSFAKTLSSLSAKNWLTNLELFVKSVKQLEDADILYGLESYTRNGLLPEYKPIHATIMMIEGRYRDVFDLFKDNIEDNLDDSSLIDFLDSCINLGVLADNSSVIDRLKSTKLKYLYKIYSQSMNELDVDVNHHLDEAIRWCNTWSDLNELSNNSSDVQPIEKYIDLTVPSCLHLISRASMADRSHMIEKTKALICDNYLAQYIFPPDFVNKSYNLYNLLLNCLKDGTTLDVDLIRSNSNDYKWNYQLYRYLNDLRLIDNLRAEHDIIDDIQYRAARFSVKQGMKNDAVSMVNNLKATTNSKRVQLCCSMLLTNLQPELYPIGEFITGLENLELDEASELRSEMEHRIARYIVKKKPDPCDSNQINDVTFLGIPMDKWKREGSAIFECDLLNRGSIETRIKTMAAVAKQLEEQYNESHGDIKVLGDLFESELRLLSFACQVVTVETKAIATNCASRILEHIRLRRSQLGEQNLVSFEAKANVSASQSIWLDLKTNLLSLSVSLDESSNGWKSALIKLLKSMVLARPELFLYGAIVNRLDLIETLKSLGDKEDSPVIEPNAPLSLIDSSIINNQMNSIDHDKKRRECEQSLAIWNNIYQTILARDGQIEAATTTTTTKWPEVILETEMFLKQVRRISYLPDEYLKSVTVQTTRRLNDYLSFFTRYADFGTGKMLDRKRLLECEAKLKTIHEKDTKAIKVVLNFCKRTSIPSSASGAKQTPYHFWFSSSFRQHLEDIDRSLKLLLLDLNGPIILYDLKKLIEGTLESLNLCYSEITKFQKAFNGKIFVGLVSPKLISIANSKLVLMPDYDCPSDHQHPASGPVTIHSVNPTMKSIPSLTSPKKLIFTGSDGKQRPFLLKAHEDLSLDKLIMELYKSINCQLMGNKETRDKYRLRCYSVTPVSGRSGLIQWIDAPSICTPYRAWLGSKNGKRVIEQLYRDTCSSLCDMETKAGQEHVNCQPPKSSSSSTHLFYQLLWAKTKQLNPSHRLVANKPNKDTKREYRQAFSKGSNRVFEHVLEEMMVWTPKDLIAKLIKYESTNSHDYYLKTRQFIQSCATHSMVGYIIGLGDRHPDNILLDPRTGEVIHVDYYVCFDMGRYYQDFPEQVPFRLTQNMIHAFGFAGLEGGFKRSCCRVLRVIRGSKAIILNHLNPTNLGFKTETKPSSEFNSKTMDGDIESLRIPPATDIARHPAPGLTRSKRNASCLPIELDICSQESVDLQQSEEHTGEPAEGEPINMMDIDSDNNGKIPAKLSPIICEARQFEQQDSYDFHHNIKTPDKMSSKHFFQMFVRLNNKLTGNDDTIRRNDGGGRLTNKPKSKYVDQQNINLIEFNVNSSSQSVEDQVDSLILEATSLSNKAAMYEGFTAWL